MGQHTPANHRRQLVALWRGSGLSMAAFARRHGVRPGTFALWVGRDRGPAGPPCTFVEVTTSRAEPPPMFVVGVDAHELRFETPPPPTWFAAVLRELAPC